MADGPITEMLAEYVAAVRAKDVDRFVALYASEVRVFDLWARWSYDGLAAWRAMAVEWFRSLGDEQVAVEFDDLRTVVGDDLAVAHAFVTFRGLAADGTALRAMDNRLTWVLRKTADGRWSVIHEHSSAPTDPETGKVDLQRRGQNGPQRRGRRSRPQAPPAKS